MGPGAICLIQLHGWVQLPHFVGIEDRVPIVDESRLQEHFECMVRDRRSLKAEHERVLVREEYQRRFVGDGRTTPPMPRISCVFVNMNRFRHSFILCRLIPACDASVNFLQEPELEDTYVSKRAGGRVLGQSQTRNVLWRGEGAFCSLYTAPPAVCPCSRESLHCALSFIGGGVQVFLQQMSARGDIEPVLIPVQVEKGETMYEKCRESSCRGCSVDFSRISSVHSRM